MSYTYAYTDIPCGGNVPKNHSAINSSLLFCSGFSGVSAVYFSLSVVSAICCTAVFITYLLIQRLWGYSSRVFLFRTVLDFLIALGHIVLFGFFHSAHSSDNGQEDKIHLNVCRFFGVFFQFALVAANLWYALLAYDLIRAIRNPFGSGSNNGWRSNVVVWSVSLFWATLLGISAAGGDPVGPGLSMFYICWISADTSVQKFAIWSLFLYYAPHFILWAFSLTVNVVAFCILFGRFPASSETRRHILRQNAFYVFILGIETVLIIPLWLTQLGLSHHIGNFHFTDRSSLAIAYLFAIIHSLRGTVDLVVWWVTFTIGPSDFKKVWQRYRAWRYRNLYLPLENLTTPLIGLEQSRVNKVLRKDVIFCINFAILDAVRLNADEENQRTHIGSVRDPFMAHVMVKWDEEVHQKEAEQRYTDPKYQETRQRRIPFRPSNSLKDFSFIDIEPTVFGLLRNSYGLNPVAYQQSFSIKDDQDVESSGMLEKFTEGKSGSFFYFTRDYRYIIKTVTSEEEAFLQKIAFRYYEYMHKNPDSVIVRLYGLHKVRLAREQRYISVVVMENLFHNEQNLKINRRYDLKGSRISRRVLKGTEKPEERYKKTLKDLDLEERIVIGPDAKAQLMEQLRKDIEFLSSLHIMDYSMLLGIHHHSEDGNRFQHSMPVEFGDGDDFMQVTFADKTGDTGPLSSSFGSSPGNTGTLERGAALAQRRPTYSSAFGDDDLDDSMEETMEARPSYVPWYRRDFGGLRSYCPHHPLNVEYVSNGSLSILIPDEGYDGLDVRSLPNHTYYFGIVDILQVYNLDKKMENFTKTRLLCKDKDGISAVDEKRYAQRFLESMDRIFV